MKYQPWLGIKKECNSWLKYEITKFCNMYKHMYDIFFLNNAGQIRAPHFFLNNAG